MACPFFLPIARLTTEDWIHAPRLPLGDPYRGECRVPVESPQPAEPAREGFEPSQLAERAAFEPTENEQRELCNCGYARGRCQRFPADAPDAVRFSMTADSKLVWILERDHAPIEFGFTDELSIGALQNEVLREQARAFIETYRRKSAVLGAGA